MESDLKRNLVYGTVGLFHYVPLFSAPMTMNEDRKRVCVAISL